MYDMISFFKKSQNNSNLSTPQISHFHKQKQKTKVIRQSPSTFEQRLEQFKLRKKPRKEIILRFSTITHGLQLPNLTEKGNLQKRNAAKKQVKHKFKIDYKDNLSNAKNYQQKGNKISIPVKKAINFSNSNYTLPQEDNNQNFSTQTARKPMHILRLQSNINSKNIQKNKQNKSKFGHQHNRKKSDLIEYKEFKNISLNSEYSQFQQASFNRQRLLQKNKKINIQNANVLDLQRVRNQFFNAKRMNQIHKQSLQLNRKLLDMESMIYQKSQCVIRHA